MPRRTPTRSFALAVCVAAALVPLRVDALGTYQAERPRAEPVISDMVSARLSGTEAVPVWIAFTDKGMDADERLASPAEYLSPRAIERRAVRGNGFTLADVPVREVYVDAVHAAGAVIRQRSRWFNAVSAWATPGDLLRIAQLPFVAEVTPIRGIRERRETEREPIEPGPGRTAGDPIENAFYGFDPIPYDRTQILDAHRNGYTGEGVLIAVFDSGFYSAHPAFRDVTLVDERDFVQGDRDTADDPTRTPPDMNSFAGNANMCHGTATWSIAGAYMPGKRVGVAFGAAFAIAKTEYPQYERHVEEDNWTAAAEWADSLGADIITSSLGYTTFDSGEGDYVYEDLDGVTTIVAQAANLATTNGILVVNSAGNGGRAGARTINSPSDSDSVLAIGAVHPGSEEITDFSSRGPAAPTPPSTLERIKPDVLAQGTRVPSATSEGCYDPAGPGGFYDDDGDPWYDLADMSGTSFSCPLTAGAAALILEAHPLWRPYEVRHVFKQTASDFAIGITPSTTRGYGAIRVQDAISFVGLGFALAPLRTGPFDVVAPGSFALDDQPVAEHPPTFSWTESVRSRSQTPVTYTVEMDADPAFPAPISWGGISDLSFTPGEDPAEGFYYWRVFASDGATYSRESRQRTRILIDYAPEAAPLESPAAGAEIDVLTPTFTWMPSFDASPDEALTYRVHVTPGGEDTIVYPFVSETSFTPPADDPVHELRSHSWWVETQDRFGVSISSSPRTFSVGAFPPRPFTLAGPADDAEVSTRRPTLTWNASTDPNPADEIAYDIFWGDSPSTMALQFDDWAETEFRVTSALRFDDGDVVYWQVRAKDEFGNETSSDILSFRVELAPLPFVLSEPVEDGTVLIGSPDFSWEEPADESPEDSFTYTVAVYTDEALTDLVAEQSGITETSVRFEPSLPDGAQLWWRVKATDEQGHETWSQARSFTTSSAPPAFVIASFPNPFSPTTHPFTLRYGVPAASDGAELRIRVFDGTGRVVRTLQKGTARAGTDFVVAWDGRSDDGARLSAGMYFVSVQVGGDEKVEKIILLSR